MKSGIYKITCTANGRIYVGSAVDLERRKHDHFKRLKRGTHSNQRLQNAYNKYGRKAFTFDVLEHVADVEVLIEREQHYIDTLEPEFNICRVAGSPLGVKHTEETCAKMRKAARERWQDETYREKISKAMKEQWQDEAHREVVSKAIRKAAKVRWQDDEYRAKMSEAAKVRWQDDEYREKMQTIHQQRQKPVEQVCKDTGKRIALFPSQTDAARQTGIDTSNISYVCNGKRKTAGGYIWRFVETDA